MNRSMRARRAGAKRGGVCADRCAGAAASSASASSRVRFIHFAPVGIRRDLNAFRRSRLVTPPGIPRPAPLKHRVYCYLMWTSVIAVAVALCAACQGSEREAPQPPAKPPGVRVVDLIPVSLSGETWQDAEPFLALYASNPKLLAASAFTPNPGGSASATAPIFVSDDGGDSWTLRNTLPSESMTADITHAVGSNPPVLYAGIIKVPNFPLNELKTTDFLSPATMTLQASRADIDQPFVRATQVSSADRVYVGLNDFDAPDGRTATVDVSLDGGATYASRRIETRTTVGQNGPSVRPAVAQDHTVYVAYFGWRSNTASNVTSDVVVVRDDSGATGATPFRSLVDPSDHLPGRLVATHVTIPWSNAPTLGQERIGSTLGIAVDPLHSDTVYLAWADRAGRGDIYTVHVRRSTDRGATWSGDLRTLTNATDASLAVSTNGTVGLLYQQVTGAALPVPAVHRRLQLPAHPRRPVPRHFFGEQHARFRQLPAGRGVSTSRGLRDASAARRLGRPGGGLDRSILLQRSRSAMTADRSQ